MKSRASLTVLAVVGALHLVGCKPGRTLVGAWDVSGMQVPGVTTSVITMQGGGTYDWKVGFNVSNVNAEVTVKGNYTVEGDKLKVNITSTDTTGAPPMLKSMVDEKVNEYMNQYGSATLQWISDDEITASFENGQALNLKRRK